MAARSELTGLALNIVAPDVISIKELADSVVERFPTTVTYGDPRPGDVPSALVSAQRARERLGWQAEIPFAIGLGELIDSVVDDV